jgi:hypothetical protein
VISQVRLSVPFVADSIPLVELQTPIFSPSLPAAPVRPRIHAEAGRYRLRLAQTVEDRDAACRLRFKVFNIELGEGLQSSYRTGLDTDDFDLFCEHLLVEDKRPNATWATTPNRSSALHPMRPCGRASWNWAGPQLTVTIAPQRC